MANEDANETHSINPQTFRALQIKHALHLEMVGLRNSRGSVAAMVRREHGIKTRDLADLYTAYCAAVGLDPDLSRVARYREAHPRKARAVTV